MTNRINSGVPLTLPPEPSPLITWLCYEPSGYRVELAESDLVQHLLIIGATGSGKSTLLNSAHRQLIQCRSRDPRERLGLLVLDPKTEGMVQSINHMAREAGRERDVAVIGPDGHFFIDLFGELKSLEDVEALTRRLLLATPPIGGDNPYWQTSTAAMFAAGLTLLVATQPEVSFDLALNFFRSWFFGRRTGSTVVEGILDRARQLQKSWEGRVPSTQQRQLFSALDQVSLWHELDSRTKSNLQSCLMLVLRPLMSLPAAKCFCSFGRPPFDPAQIAQHGVICVVSVNALNQPELAQFVFRLARQVFFDAVQKRTGSGHRLCGLIADEFPLVARREDAEQLATVRSRRCFVLAAIQGLANLDDKIGECARRAVVQNFNSIVFLRSLEEETGRLANFALGTRQQPCSPGLSAFQDCSLATLSPPRQPPIWVPVCPPGALNRLASHQAFILFRDGSRTEFPVWFAPPFEIQEEVKAAASAPSSTPIGKFTPEYQAGLMASQGIERFLTPEMVAAAQALCAPSKDAQVLLKKVISFFRSKASIIPNGLELLPLCWLAALPGILGRLRRPRSSRLPFMLKEVGCEQGMLLLGFAEEQPPDMTQATEWDQVRVAVNRSIYPSLWRPLSRHLRLELWLWHPELRPILSAQTPEFRHPAP